MSKTEKTPKSTQKGKNPKALQMTPEEEQKENEGPPSNSTTPATSPAINKAPPSSSTPIATKLETDTSQTRKVASPAKTTPSSSKTDPNSEKIDHNQEENDKWKKWLRTIHNVSSSLDSHSEKTSELIYQQKNGMEQLASKIDLLSAKIDATMGKLDVMADYDDQEDEPTPKKSKTEAPTKYKGSFPGSRKDRQTTLLNSKLNPSASWAELMRVEQQNEQKTEYKIPKKKVPNLRPCCYCEGNHRDWDCRRLTTAAQRLEHLQKHGICPQCGGHKLTGPCPRPVLHCGKCGAKHMSSICYQFYK